MRRKGKFKKIDVRKIVPKAPKKGAIPGTIDYVGNPRSEKVKIDSIEYLESNVIEENVESIDRLKELLISPPINWIRVTGVHDSEILNQIGEIAGINLLDMEDVANTTQRPRIEERDDYIFLVFKLLQLDPETGDVLFEQVSIVLAERFVISFHETTPTVFDSLRQRIITGKGRIQKMKTDYLAFTIADVIIDHYFTILDDIGDQIEDTEESLIFAPSKSSQENIYRLKRRLIYVKKAIWPVREVLNSILRSDHKLINKDSRIYFRNIYDHTVQVLETIDSLREITTGMMDLYLSTVSNKMNEIMKVLTIFSALFIPLTFLAGVYGMNFKFIPELDWLNGYYFFWGFCVILSIIMLIYFKRRKWL